MDFQIEYTRRRRQTGAAAAPRLPGLERVQTPAPIRRGAGHFPAARPAWPGLEAFRVADRDRLRGREIETGRLVSLFTHAHRGQAPVAWITGDSGVGKTSLVMAGVIPRLFADADSRRIWLRIVPERDAPPQEIVMTIAREILRRVADREESALDFEGRLRQFALLLRQDSTEAAAEYLAACYRRDGGGAAPCLLFVDQFERVLSGGPESIPEMALALRFLLDLSFTGGFSSLLAVRSDGAPMVRAAMARTGLDGWGEALPVGLPDFEALDAFLASATSDIADSGSVRVSGDLLGDLKSLIRDWPGALPFAAALLSTLSRKFPGSDWIEKAAADDFGGIGPILAGAADSAMASHAMKDDLAVLFAALHPASGNLKEPVSIRMLDFVGEDPARRLLVEALAEARVLQITGGSSEAARLAWAWAPGLMAWERARDWIVERRRLRARLLIFEQSRRRWESDERTPVLLLHASRLVDDARRLLAQHRRWPLLEAPMIEYLETSIALDEQIRHEGRARLSRKRLAVVGLALFMGIAAVVATVL